VEVNVSDAQSKDVRTKTQIRLPSVARLLRRRKTATAATTAMRSRRPATIAIATIALSGNDVLETIYEFNK
jgi:hypothetical protein